MLERLLDAEASEHGTLTEEIELICTMTGFRRRFLIHHLGEGFFRSIELEPSWPALAIYREQPTSPSDPSADQSLALLQSPLKGL